MTFMKHFKGEVSYENSKTSVLTLQGSAISVLMFTDLYLLQTQTVAKYP